jgi:hypothetical protein
VGARRSIARSRCPPWAPRGQIPQDHLTHRALDQLRHALPALSGVDLELLVRDRCNTQKHLYGFLHSRENPAMHIMDRMLFANSLSFCLPGIVTIWECGSRGPSYLMEPGARAMLPASFLKVPRATDVQKPIVLIKEPINDMLAWGDWIAHCPAAFAAALSAMYSRAEPASIRDFPSTL